MSAYSPLQVALVIWMAVTLVYVLLFVYRAVVGAKEEDTLYLSAGESHMAEEQRQIMQRVRKLDPITRIFGFAALGMTVVLAGVWSYGVFRQLF
jgi:hypothetical protein